MIIMHHKINMKIYKCNFFFYKNSIIIFKLCIKYYLEVFSLKNYVLRKFCFRIFRKLIEFIKLLINISFLTMKNLQKE